LNHLAAAVLLTVFFTVSIFQIRGRLEIDAVVQMVRLLLTCGLYGTGTVYLFIGLTKKMLKYDPSRIQIIKWSAGMAAFFAVSQFLHEVFLAFTGQHRP